MIEINRVVIIKRLRLAISANVCLVSHTRLTVYNSNTQSILFAATLFTRNFLSAS